jgi:hypothetical protein
LISSTAENERVDCMTLAGSVRWERLAKAGNEYVMSTPEEFIVFLRAEIAKWTKVVKEANLKIE